MILDVGSCYIVVSDDYGTVDHKAQHNGLDDLFKNDVFLVLEQLNLVESRDHPKAEKDYYYHYKILINNKIRYIVVLAKHDDLENYLKKVT